MTDKRDFEKLLPVTAFSTRTRKVDTQKTSRIKVNTELVDFLSDLPPGVQSIQVGVTPQEHKIARAIRKQRKSK